MEREALVTQLAESRRAMREMRNTMLLLADSVRRALPDQGDAIVRDAVQLAHKADSHAAAAASPVDAESRGAGIGQDDGHDNVASGTPAAASVVPSIAATAGSLDHAPPMYGASVASQDVEVSEHAHTSPRDAGALRVGDLDAPVALDPAVSARGVVVRFTERPIGLKLGPNRVSTGALSAYAACIKRVRRNGSAYKTGQVKELDVIAAVYGQSMRGLSYEAVKQCVQRVGSAVRHHRSGDVTFVRPTVQELAASGVTLQPRMAGSVDSSDGDTLSRASTSQLGASPVAIGKDAPREEPWHGVGSDGEAQHSPAHGGPDRGRGRRRSSSSSRGGARQGQGDVTAEAAFGDRRDSPPDEGAAVHARHAPVLSDTAPEHGEPQDVDGGGPHDAQSNAGGSHSDGSAAASEGHGDADDAMVHRHKGYEPHRPRTESSLSRRSSGDRRGSSGDRRGSSDRRSSQQSSRRSSRRTSSGSQRGASAGDGAGAGAGAGAGSNRRGSHRSAASDHDHDRRSSRASRSGSRAAGGSTVQGAELSEDDIDFVVNVVRNLSGVPLVKHVKGGWLSKSHKRVFWITREAGTRHLQLAYVAVCG